MDFTRFAAIIRRYFRLIVVVAVVVAATAFVVSSVLPKQYDAEARLLVGSVTDPNLDRLNAYQQLAQTYAALAVTTPVLTRAAGDIGLSDDPVRLAQRISVRAPLGQSLVRIGATAGSPNDAANLANAVANELVGLGRATPGGESIASVVQPALPPPDPSSPRVALNTLIGAILGIALGLFFAVLLAWRSESRQANQAAATEAADMTGGLAVERLGKVSSR